MRAYRGTILNPRSEHHCALYADGLLVVNDAGQVAAVGPTEAVARRFGSGALELVESEALPLILPAFVDVHLHWVQNRIKGTAHGQGLLKWLDECVWPEEIRFADPAYAQSAAAEFFREVARHGTLAGAVYSSVHESALESFRPPFGHFHAGNVLMNQNAPPALTMDTDTGLAIAERWAKKATETPGGLSYAISPRFAATCSMELMQRAAQLAQRYGCLIQTHLAENLDEVTWVHKLFPDCRTYTGVYQRAGLLGPRTILGHCIYLDDDELGMLKAAAAAVAHCPTSNEALGSGRMPIERIRRAGLRWALASDIAAGPSLSMLQVMNAFLRVHAEAGLRFNPAEALYRATLAGAEVLGQDSLYGNLEVGKEANFLILEVPALRNPSNGNEALAALLSDAKEVAGPLVRMAFFRGAPIV